jgi:acetate kinase
MAIFGFVVTCLLLLGLFLYYKSGAKVKNGSRVTVNDLNAQTLYINSKHGDEDKNLSIKEKVEISWQFLYEITEVILNKFTSNDRQEVKTIGHKLIDNGARYNHSVDLNIKQTLSKTQNISIDQEKKVSQGRGI